MKRCIKCSLLLQNENFYFRKDTNTYRNECKKCHYKQTKRYHQENKEKMVKYKREYQQKYKERLNKISRQYHKEHKEELNRNGREYYKNHIEKERETRRRYRQNNKYKISKQRKSQKDKANKIRKKWRHKNKDEVNAKNRERMLKKKLLFEDFTLGEWLQKVEATEGICPICERSYSEMSPFCATLDHTPPISKAPKGYHYTIDDITPMCGSCNSSKINKLG